MLLRRRPRLNKQRALAALPVRNQAVEWRAEQERTVLVLRRREDWVGRLLSLLFVVPRERKVELDGVGSYVWQQCDGRHTVSDLIQALARKYKLDRKEAEVSLTNFLRLLGKRKLIAIAVPREAAPGSKENERTNVAANRG